MEKINSYVKRNKKTYFIVFNNNREGVNMRVFKDIDRCSGCTACKHSCPYNAISMVEDKEGFKYPEIDGSKCVDCGICRQICPFHRNYSKKFNLSVPYVYAVKNRNDDVRFTSSSGGVFTAISDYVLENSGVVYGAAFDENFTVCHQKSYNKRERDKFKGSKYVQSDLDDIFSDIKAELDAGKMVLFTGTPCQTAGLRAFLKNKQYERLILCDLVCNGVPSPLLWKEYTSFITEKSKSELKAYNFRYKEDSWHNGSVFAKFQNGNIMKNEPLTNIFINIFYSHNAHRPSCYNCVFTNFERPSDVTIGDFWGIEEVKPQFDDDKGISLVIINSKTGIKVFNSIKDDIIFMESNMNECIQRNLVRPTPISSSRDKFWEDYNKRGFEYIAKKYTSYGLINRMKLYVIKPMLKKLGLRE